jgi:ubiquitin C-terminal hydrolase
VKARPKFQLYVRDTWPALFAGGGGPGHEDLPFDKIWPFRSLSSALQISITCLGCGRSRFKHEQFFAHSLDFASLDALDDTVPGLLSKHFASEERELSCETCRATRARFEFQFAQMPEILVLHFKRFVRMDEATHKRLDRVLFPETLDVSKWVGPDAACPMRSAWPIFGSDSEAQEVSRAVHVSRQGGDAWKYRLESTVHHLGEDWRQGHFTCVSRDGHKFSHFNDSSVQSLSSDWLKEDKYTRSLFMCFYRLV